MKNEFVLAFNEVLEEKQLPKEVILKALESAMVSAYRRAVNASNAQHIEAQIDPETGKVAIFAEKEVVEEPQDTRTEVSLEEARRIDPNAELNGMVIMETTPKDFGRVAAQTARQVIQQRIRDAERQAQLDFYQKQLGEIVSVWCRRSTTRLDIGLEMRAEGMLGRKDMIPGERFRIHDRVRTLIAEVKDSPRGPQIILSPPIAISCRLLENEVPEIYHGVVEIRSIAREPGERAKVAVSATQAGSTRWGACVGIRGVRIQAIVRELHDEKIDVIEWNPDPALFIAKAISPARVLGVYLSDKSGSSKTATVVVPEDQLSLAIGRDGQNARLAAKLTGWRIDIKSLSEATADTVYRLQQEAELAPLAEQEQETIPLLSVMLAKKAEGRPLTHEEYDQMAQFVDRVEKRSAARLEPPKPSKESQQLKDLRAQIPAAAFEQSLLDSGLSEHVANILQGAGYQTTGDLILQMKLQPDEILRLQGIGPRTMMDITALVDSLIPPPAEVVEETAPAAEAAVEEEISQPETTPAEPLEPQPGETTAEVAESVQPVAEVAAAHRRIEEAAKARCELKAGEGEQPVAEGEAAAEEEVSFDELFKLKAELIQPSDTDEEEEEEEEDATGKTKKRKKKKKKHVQVEYDPDREVVVVHKKHKRDGSGWEWES